MSFGSALSYVFSNIGKVFSVFSGLSYFKTGGITKSLNVVKAQGTHFDMRNAQDTVYSGWSIGFWIAAFGSIVTFILGCIFDGFVLSSLIATVVSLLVSACIIAFIITIGKKNESHWKGWLVKLFIILGLLSFIGSILSVAISLFATGAGLIGTIIGGIGYGAVFGGIGVGAAAKVAIELILTFIIDLAITVLSLCNMCNVLTGMNMAVVTNGNQMGYNNGMNYNNYNDAQNYNPNGFNAGVGAGVGAGVAGLGAVNNVKNSTVDIPNQPQNGFNQNMNNGFNQNQNMNNGFNQPQNNFGQNNGFNQNGFGQNNFNQGMNQGQVQQNVPTQNVQMYACPYCGQAIVHGANPCPHCNNPVNWG